MRLLKEVRNLTENYHVKSGMFHYLRGEYNQAEEFFRKALKDEKELSQTDLRNARYYLTMSLMDLAMRLHTGGDVELAAEQLQRAADVGEGFPDVHFRHGGVLEELGRTDDAIAAYRQATLCHPGYLEAFVALGFCLLRAGRVEATAEAFESARQLKTQGINLPHARGIELLRGGDAEAAANQFHQAFRTAPMVCEELRLAGLERLGEEEYDAAVEQFDQAIALCPKYPDLHNLRGIALFELERIEEAVDAFALSAELGPGYLVSRLNLAFALVAAEEHRRAEEVLEKILVDNPSEPVALAKLEELRSGKRAEKRRPVNRGTTR
jgi:tetratricopeptide (TPR) repeat protein